MMPSLSSVRICTHESHLIKFQIAEILANERIDFLTSGEQVPAKNLLLHDSCFFLVTLFMMGKPSGITFGVQNYFKMS